MQTPEGHTLVGDFGASQALSNRAINAQPLEKVKSAIAKAHRAKIRRLRGVSAL